MEDAGGRRLDWFWREWFIENARFDQSVDIGDREEGRRHDAAWRCSTATASAACCPSGRASPSRDGSTEDFVYPAEVWSTNSRHYVRQYAFRNKTLVRVELDPEQRLLDINRGNNSWGAPQIRP